MDTKEGIKLLGLKFKGGEPQESFRVGKNGENGENGENHGDVVSKEAMPVSKAVVPAEQVKKKRGRPRKYAGDGSLAAALSPMPISASIPLSGSGGGDFPGWKPGNRGHGIGIDSFKKKKVLEFEAPIPISERAAHCGGSKFSVQVLTVNPGEDVAMKIISFSQEANKAVCVLSASGAISNVTLRQPNSSGGTVTYEGRFQILSLTGSFIPSDNGVTKSRSGGMSVTLAFPDGHVLGGGVAGILLAANPVQVVLGSFLPGYELEQYPKTPQFEHSASFNTVTSQPVVRTDGAYSAPTPHHLPSSLPSYHHTDNVGPVVTTYIHTRISAPQSIYSEL